MDRLRPTDNPYSAPRGDEEAHLAMSDERLVRRGRIHMLAVVSICMGFELMWIVVGLSNGNAQRSIESLPRLVLTFGLLFALYRGAGWARHTMIALLCIGLCIGFVAFRRVDRLRNIPGIVVNATMLFGYATSLGLLLFSRGIREFQYYQRDARR